MKYIAKIFKIFEFKFSPEQKVLIPVLIVAASSIFYLFNVVTLRPYVVDEFYYYKYTLLQPYSSAQVPNYIFFLIYSASSYCKNGWYICAKVENIALYALGLLVFYRISLCLLGFKNALIVLVLTILSFVAFYTSFFMPEVLYFTFFWGLLYYLIFEFTPSLKCTICLSLLFGLFSSVKPHALFILPSIIFYIFFMRPPVAYRFRKRFLIASLFLAGALAIKFAIGYAFAGNNGLTIFGSTYGEMALRSKFDIEFINNFIATFFINLGGHLIFFVLFTQPLIVTYFCFRRSFAENLNNQSQNFLLLFFLIAISLILITSAFAGVASVSNPGEVYRIHTRYYYFIYPGLLVAWFILFAGRGEVIKLRALLISFLYLLFAVYLLFNGFVPYTPNDVDSPSIFLLSSAKWFPILWLVYTCLTFLVIYNNSATIYSYISLIFFAFYITSNTIYLFSHLHHYKTVDNQFDSALKYFIQYSDSADYSNLEIFAPQLLSGPLILSQINLPTIGANVSGVSSPTDSICSDKKYVLVIGDMNNVCDAYSVIHVSPIKGYGLYHKKSN